MTSSVTIYHLPSSKIVNHPFKERCCINVIDTPGFGDTRGTEWDRIISSMLTQLLNTIEMLDYIMIVIKSTDNRLFESSKFVYSSIQKLYAVDITPRVIGLFTFSDGDAPNAREAVKAAKIGINEEFLFNNSAIFFHKDASPNCFINFKDCMQG